MLSDEEKKIYKFAMWIEKHPYKTILFIEIPMSVLTTLITILLLK